MRTKQKTAIILSLTLTLFLLVCACCKKLFPPDQLCLPKNEYTGTNLRIDGYYYFQYTAAGGDEYMTTLFFYKNGVMHYGGAFPKIELSQQEEEWTSNNWNQWTRNNRTWWGVFVVDDSVIKFARWYPSEPPVRASVREGVILNDTTFRITQVYRCDGSNLRSEDRLYHFKAFSPKPDSTNNFVK